MNFLAAALIACLVTIVLGYLATQPEELRRLRWLKIAFSIPPALVIASASVGLDYGNAILAAFGFAILAFIWKSPIAYAGSLIFVRLLQGDVNRVTTGIRADFGAAKALHKHGDLDDALRHTKAELEKDPSNYEGLIFLAQLYVDLDEPDRALKTLNLLLASPSLTHAQRIAVTASREFLEQQLLPG